MTEPLPPAVTSVTQVFEGDLVKLQCSVPVPCSTLPSMLPSITWHFQNNSFFPESQTEPRIFMAEVWTELTQSKYIYTVASFGYLFI